MQICDLLFVAGEAFREDSRVIQNGKHSYDVYSPWNDLLNVKLLIRDRNFSGLYVVKISVPIIPEKTLLALVSALLLNCLRHENGGSIAPPVFARSFNPLQPRPASDSISTFRARMGQRALSKALRLTSFSDFCANYPTRDNLAATLKMGFGSSFRGTSRDN